MAEIFNGFYRAKVVDNKDPMKYGRVMMWIPDVMPEIDDTQGIWARPANNPNGGRNMEEDSEHHYSGSSYIPKIGSWMWIFFERGDVNLPYYFASLDLENTRVLPENQQGENYEDKWTIFKSHRGRCVVISDDPDDERVEITGKKREIKNPPSGDFDSVYKIDGNQTTILLDEQEGREKLLIRTYKGDFIHVDIDEQKLQCYFKNDIVIQTDGTLHITAAKNITMKAGESIFEDAGQNIHENASVGIYNSSGNHHTKCSGDINRDGAMIVDQGGAAKPASKNEPVLPLGDRNS